MWTDQELTTLRQMWQEGASTREIAEVTGHKRNTVISKAHYLCLPPHPKGRRPVLASRVPRPQHRARRVSAHLFVPVSEPPPAPAPVGLMIEPRVKPTRTLLSVKECECHWPIGEVDEEGFGFCGAPTNDERKSYCPQHEKLSRTPSKPWYERRAWFR